MERRVYIIPGFKESHLKQHSYKKVAAIFAKAGFTPVQVTIAWEAEKPYNFRNYTKQFLSQFKKQRGVKSYVLGFSYGATTAFLTAAKTKPATLILCSLSPYFVEDHKNIEAKWLRQWKKNFRDSDYEFKKLAPKISSNVYLLAGDKEHPSVLKRARDARKRLAYSSLTIIKGAKHDIGQKEYLAALERLAIKLE